MNDGIPVECFWLAFAAAIILSLVCTVAAFRDGRSAAAQRTRVNIRAADEFQQARRRHARGAE